MLDRVDAWLTVEEILSENPDSRSENPFRKSVQWLLFSRSICFSALFFILLLHFTPSTMMLSSRHSVLLIFSVTLICAMAIYDGYRAIQSRLTLSVELSESDNIAAAMPNNGIERFFDAARNPYSVNGASAVDELINSVLPRYEFMPPPYKILTMIFLKAVVATASVYIFFGILLWYFDHFSNDSVVKVVYRWSLIAFSAALIIFWCRVACYNVREASSGPKFSEGYLLQLILGPLFIASALTIILFEFGVSLPQAPTIKGWPILLSVLSIATLSAIAVTLWMAYIKAAHKFDLSKENGSFSSAVHPQEYLFALRHYFQRHSQGVWWSFGQWDVTPKAERVGIAGTFEVKAFAEYDGQIERELVGFSARKKVGISILILSSVLIISAGFVIFNIGIDQTAFGWDSDTEKVVGFFVLLIFGRVLWNVGQLPLLEIYFASGLMRVHLTGTFSGFKGELAGTRRAAVDGLRSNFHHYVGVTTVKSIAFLNPMKTSQKLNRIMVKATSDDDRANRIIESISDGIRQVGQDTGFPRIS